MSWRLQAVAWVSLLVLSGCRDRDRTILSDGNLRVTPTELRFEQVGLFSGGEQVLTASNVGRNRVQIQRYYFEGVEEAELRGLPADGKIALASGARAELKVRFRPNKEGAQQGFLVMETDSSRAPVIRIPLSGEGIDARAGVNASELDFGRIEAESEKTLTFPVSNPSRLGIRVTPRWVGADRDEFVGEPISLGAGEEKTVSLTFRPSRVGKKRVALALSRCEGCQDALVAVRAEALDRAVVAEPTILDFGQVALDAVKPLKARVRNISTEPMTVTGAGLAEGADPGYQVTPGTFGVLPPNGVAELDVRFGPTHLGGALGEVRFAVVSRRNPTTSVRLNGFGGAPELCVAPTSIDFGAAPIGAKLSQVINISNCGSPTGQPLRVEEVRLEPVGGPPTTFSFSGLAVPQSFAAGAGTSFKVVYEPSAEGQADAVLSLRTVGGQDQTVTIPITGTARVYPACDLQVTPTAVDFGNVEPGETPGVLGVRIANRGRDLCAVKNIRIAESAGGAFFLPGGEIDGLVLGGADAFSVQVAYGPRTSASNVRGIFQVELSNPEDPVRQVPLTANATATCVDADPKFVDFGPALRQCPPAPRTVALVNNCATQVTLNGVSIGSGTADGEFSLSGALPPAGQAIPSRGRVQVTVNYGATVYGQSYSPLFFSVAGLERPILVPLLGEFSPNGDQQDRFVQTDGSRVDVLFVVNNSRTMVEEQPKLQAALPRFAAAIRGDFRVAVTTTGLDPFGECAAAPGGSQGGENGRFVPVNGAQAQKVLTPATPNFVSALQANA
ncbi:MAG TPA: choice-of-anchor D domain-containing protein, partial [Myxococcaceae bacterium]|nr:choice-of-anchor D domain-containing protein [Myxococcaceae bacterium]